VDPSPYPPVERGPHNHIGVAPSTYKGVLYRSMLEARVARWVDMHFPVWLYESGPNLLGIESARTLDGLFYGYQLDVGRYRPDFWLPSVRTFLEVKGDMGCHTLARPIELARRAAPQGIQVIVVTRGKGVRFDLYAPCGRDLVPATFARCSACGSRYFHAGGPTDCRACGVASFTGGLSSAPPKEESR